jgi:hypothetical protein
MVRRPTDRIDVWWNLATDHGEPTARPDEQILLDGADDLIDAVLLLMHARMEDALNHPATPLVVPIVGFAVFSILGAVCIFLPQKIQRYALSESFARLSPAMRLGILKRHVGSRPYIWELRIAGVLCLLAAADLLHTIITWAH